MPSNDDLRQLMDSADLHKLLARKFRMSLVLSLLMLLVYSLYFIAIAWLPDWMGQSPDPRGIVSNGIWFTVFCVLFSVLLSAFYIWWTNTCYDKELLKFLQDSASPAEPGKDDA